MSVKSTDDQYNQECTTHLRLNVVSPSPLVFIACVNMLHTIPLEGKACQEYLPFVCLCIEPLS